MRRLSCLLPLILGLLAMGSMHRLSAAAGAPDPSALIASLAQPLPAQTAFFERRDSPLLIEPLMYSGELQRPEAGVLVKRVVFPQIETTRIADGRVSIERDGQPRRQFSLKRAPELMALTASFEAVLSGQFGLLEKHYKIVSAGASDAWTIDLKPRDARLARRVTAMRLLGSGSQLRCIDLALAGDEDSRMWVGDSAAAAEKTSDDAARNALCTAVETEQLLH